ncbi:integrase catalytic domain-containing protein [Trichonephila inaurata madagascariensis]|uniref:Integrase catalytic domain-containing protein n=1 Tax=Trichonephila inaurata madagascariensis TaxID=2747483 RepID=A0A8X6IJK8_9ARAC|nr:integrase catalytic domain-containing protein [Trichonephila inaurata madagascariensis]
MDLERLKEKRKILRMSFTKHLTKIETTLSKEISVEFNKEAKLKELLSLKSQLTEKLNELIKADENIQLQIKVSEMAADTHHRVKNIKIEKVKPNLDLSSHNVETFHYTRVTFGVKCSPFLLAAVIRLHVEKYINKYKKAYEMLNELYVDDLINSTSNTTEALQLNEEMIHILGEAGMNLRRWTANSTTLHEAWKRANIDCWKTSEKSGVQQRVTCRRYEHCPIVCE